MKKGDSVTYDANGGLVRARVLCAHRDGTCSIEAMFFLDANGLDRPGYLGDKFRTAARLLTPLTYPAIERAFALDAAKHKGRSCS